MFRSVVLSTVLLLTAGPHVALVCQAWCDPSVAAATGCHDRRDDADAPKVVARDTCDDGVTAAAVLTRDDVRRGAGAAAQAVLDRRLPVLPLATDARLRHEPGHPLSPGTPPLVTALRI